MEQPDEIIHQPLRMKILATLKALPDGERLEFVRLRAIVNATEGNLGAHIATLEKAGYIKVEKDFHNNRPRTRVSMTRTGRRSFQDYVDYLREILEPTL
jgi:DNA-binding MarR family transcriptional regulator